MARKRTSAESLAGDRMVIEHSWNRGFVRDSEVPAGGLYDVEDWMVEKPGLIYKRGGWERHSPTTGGTHIEWVGTVHIPTRVVEIDNTMTLFDVTSENSPTIETIGSMGFFPRENSPSFFTEHESLIVTDHLAEHAPKLVRYDQTTDAILIEDFQDVNGMGANPPIATYSCVHGAGYVVLARGGGDYDLNYINRVWFGLSPTQRIGNPTAVPPVPPATDWDTSAVGNWVDMSHEITGLASVQGVLLVFGPHTISRILGSLPFGNTGSDMRVQPASNVGCIDARSIVYADENVIFAGEEGVWISNGSGLESLTSRPDGNGIQHYWRSLFPRHHTAGEHNFRQLVGGMLNRDFYLISILDHLNNYVDCLLCYVPGRVWTRVTNLAALSMAHGRDEQQVGELYFGEAGAPFVSRAVPMLYPEVRNKQDGNGLGPTPSFITRNLGADNPGMKAYGYGWMSYRMTDPSETTSISIGGLTGLNRHRTLTATTMGATGVAGDDFVDRQRFQLFTDTQAMWLKVDQTGPSEETEISYLEAEERAYTESADSLGQ